MACFWDELITYSLKQDWHFIERKSGYVLVHVNRCETKEVLLLFFLESQTSVPINQRHLSLHGIEMSGPDLRR